MSTDDLLRALDEGLKPNPATTARRSNFAGPAVDTAASAQAVAHAGGSASLGINAKSASPPRDRVEARAERYRLQWQASRVMHRHGAIIGLEHPANGHRVCKCRRVRVGDVQVLRSQEHGAAHYGGLVICGSAWACPVCAAKIGERRRVEIAQAFEYAYKRLAGKKVVMVTLTFPHTAWGSLEQMMSQQKDALKRLRSGKVWQKHKQRIGFHGLVRSLEITHGRHGWHPHTHEAWIVDRDTDAAALRARITQRWAASCRRAGLLEPESESDFQRHAVHVLDWASDSDYMQKQDESRHWGADREIASASTKRSKGRAPFALLEDVAAGDRQAARLFRDYVLATKGRAQVYWSRGLKAAAGVEDKTDEQLAEEEQDQADLLALMDAQQWRAVLQEDARSFVLDLAESAGWRGLADWFQNRGLHPPTPKVPEDAEHFWAEATESPPPPSWLQGEKPPD